MDPCTEANIGRLLSLNRPLTIDEVERAMASAGRNSAPWIVYNAFLYKRLPVDVAAHVVPSAWSGAELPQGGLLTQSMWREMFDYTGYTVDGKRAERPAGPIVLYRGASKPYRRRWAWTSDQGTAETFAVNRSFQFANEDEDGIFLWRASVPPDKLFASIHAIGRGEAEYIVDTRGLRIEPIAFGAIAQASRRRLVAAGIISEDRL